MDTIIQKAFDLYKHTARVPVKTILTATAWLEEKHHRKLCSKLAMAIALHYLILALRHDPGMESEVAKEYCASAARWQAQARKSRVTTLAAKATQEN